MKSPTTADAPRPPKSLTTESLALVLAGIPTGGAMQRASSFQRGDRPSCPGARRLKRLRARSLSLAEPQICDALTASPTHLAVNRLKRGMEFGTLSICSVFCRFSASAARFAAAFGRLVGRVTEASAEGGGRNGALADEIRARKLRLGRSGARRRHRMGRRAQQRRPASPEGDEARRRGVPLPQHVRQGGGRDHAGRRAAPRPTPRTRTGCRSGSSRCAGWRGR